MSGIRLGRLPERAPVRLSLGLSPELHSALMQYAELYREVYGQEESVADLIPYMLQAFLDSDRRFVRARRGDRPGSRAVDEPRAEG